MQEQSVPQVELREIRNVPEVLNATFDFIRLNIKVLRTSALLYVLPWLVVANLLLQFIGSGYLMRGLANLSPGMQLYAMYARGLSTGSDAVDLLLTLVAFASYVAGITFLVAFVHAVVLVYQEKEREGRRLEVGEVWKKMKSLFWSVFGTNIGLGVILFAGFFILMMGVGISGAISPVFLSLGFFISMLAIPAVFVTYALYYPVRFIEGRAFSVAFSRAWGLISGNWWRTCGLLAVCICILLGLSVILNLPTVVIQLLVYFDVVNQYELLDPSSTWSLLNSAFSSLFAIAWQLLAVFPLLSLIFHYYSQKERQDFSVLIEKIEEIGGTGQSVPPVQAA